MQMNLAEFSKLYEQNTQRVLDDVYRLLSSFPSLIPKEDVYCVPETLLCLTGTVPITFRGSKYNIPIMLWIPKLYPFCAPTSFVTPTKEMVIKQNHKNVDPNGQCSVPYIEFWNNSSNLMELVTELCATFSKEPPLFAKSTQPITSHASFRNPNPKPLPPTPPGYTSPPPAYSSPPPHQPPTHYTPPAITTPPPQLSPPAVRVSPTPQANNPLNNSTLYLKNDLLRQTTQQLQRKLDEFFKTTTKDMEMFMANQSTLELRSTELEKSIQALRIEEGELEHAAIAALAKNEEIDNWIARMDQPKDIDEVFAPSDAISQQQFAVVSEDHSIEDVLYYLGKGLASGKIDLDSYLKEVRSLSRQQFFLRALAHKLSAMREEKSR